ncbi:RHS repeat domain-containing protein, partial [Patescibacteria group bacterium]
MVQQMTQYDENANPDSGNYGSLAVNRVFYNGLGQQVQSRASWRDSGIGIEVDGEGRKDVLTSAVFNSLGQPERSSLSYTAEPFGAATPDQPYLAPDWNDQTGLQRINRFYDGLGRPTMVTYPGRAFEAIGYDDNNPLVTAFQDKNCTDDTLPGTRCTIKETEADAFGQNIETREIQFDGLATYTTSYQYHPALGSLTQTTDTYENVVNKMEYDSLGRKTKMWDVDMSPAMSGDDAAWTYEYDNVGNLIFQTDPKNRSNNHKTRLCYDELGRLTSKSIVNLNASDQNCGDSVIERLLEYEYDIILNNYSNVGHKTSFTSWHQNDNAQTVNYHYNNQGLLARQIITLYNMPDNLVNDQELVTDYGYDLGGRPTVLGYPSNDNLAISQENVSNTYNGPNLSSINLVLPEYKDIVIGAYYNKDGQMTSMQLANGVRESFGYNPLNNRLSSLSVNNEVSDWGTDRMDLTYNYDPVGNILDINDLSGVTEPEFNLTQHFEYDSLYRLTGVVNDLQVGNSAYYASYSYDDVGNILSKSEGPDETLADNLEYTYSTTSDSLRYHRPSVVVENGQTRQFSYDERVGNLTDDDVNSYVYDSQNKLVEVGSSQDMFPGEIPTLTPTPSVTSAVTPTPAVIETLEVRVNASSDDAEESSSGSVGLTSSDLELVQESTNQTVGVRFNSINIPQGAIIQSAYVQFAVDETRNEDPINLTIHGDDSDNASTFSTSTNNITNRSKTSSSVSWSPPSWTTLGEAGSDQETSDIRLIIQEIVDRPGWNSGNSLALIISGTGRRVAESYNGSSSKAPLLHIEYGGGAPQPTSTITPPPTLSATPTPSTTQALEVRVNASSDDAEESSTGGVGLTSSDLELIRDSSNQTVGIRFNSVNIPQGATVQAASVQFTVDETTTETTNLTIHGQDTDNAPTINKIQKDI